MRRWLGLGSAIGVLALLFLMNAALTAQESGFTPSPHIYKITAAGCKGDVVDRVQSGFRAKDQVGIFTALHGVIGCETLIAEPGGDGKTFHDLVVGKVDIDHDIAVLWSKELASEPLVGLVVLTQTLTIDQDESFQVIGYPFGLFRQKPMIDVKILERTALGNLLSNEAIIALDERDSPALEIEVLSIQAHLVPGHSGAPVLNHNGEVVAIGNGGLDLGRVEMGWAMPWEQIEPSTIVIGVSQEVSWDERRRFRDLAKSDSNVAFAYSAPEQATATPNTTDTRTPTTTSTPTASPPFECFFAVSVVDEVTGEGIRGARLSIIVGTLQDIGVTDSDGYYRLGMPCQDRDLLNARIRIFAEGYESHTSSIYLADQTKEVLLRPIDAPTPEATVTPRSTETPTPQSARFDLGDWVEAAASSQLREYPGTTEIVLETLPRNEIFRIDGGPREADGYQWWQLRELDGTVRGWIAYIDDRRDPSLLPVRAATPTTEATPVRPTSTPKSSQPLLQILKPQWGDSMSGRNEIRWRYNGQLGPNQGFDLMLRYEWDPIHRGIVDVSQIMQGLVDYGNGEYGVTVNVSSAPLVQQYCDASYLLYVVVVNLNPYERTGIESAMIDVRMRPIGGGC